MPRRTKTRRVKRHRNVDELAARKFCRLFGVPWETMVDTRKRLQAAEDEQRAADDEARQAGWSAYLAYAGWSRSHQPFWRSGFQRYLGPRFARGADLTSIPRYDEIADAVREACEGMRGWSTEDIWDLLLSEYPPRQDVGVHYRNAMALLAANELGNQVPF